MVKDEDRVVIERSFELTDALDEPLVRVPILVGVFDEEDYFVAFGLESRNEPDCVPVLRDYDELHLERNI